MGNNIKIDVKVKKLKISAEFGTKEAPVSDYNEQCKTKFRFYKRQD